MSTFSFIFASLIITLVQSKEHITAPCESAFFLNRSDDKPLSIGANFLYKMDNFIDVPGYEGLYKVNRDGQIYSTKRRGNLGGEMRPSTYTGYAVVCLSKNNNVKHFKLHRLVAATFIPNPENKPAVNHKDGDKLNNCVDNLEWCTNRENIRHAHEIGLSTHRKAYNSPDSKLTKEQRIDIIETYANRLMTQEEIAKKYGVTQSLVPLVIRHYLREALKSGFKY